MAPKMQAIIQSWWNYTRAWAFHLRHPAFRSPLDTHQCRKTEFLAPFLNLCILVWRPSSPPTSDFNSRSGLVSVLSASYYLLCGLTL